MTDGAEDRILLAGAAGPVEGEVLVAALAAYDANVLAAGRPGFSPVALLTGCQ